MDPSQPAVKGTEGHHLFPRAHQEKVLGITDLKRINQAANYAPTDWSTNIAISDKAPAQYWPRLVASRSPSPEWLAQQMYWHALPDGWEHLEYEDFLAARRLLMANVTKDAYEQLLHSGAKPVQDMMIAMPEPVLEPSLSELVEQGLLQAGDQLDPVAPEWEIDALVGEDGTLTLEGTHQFDSLDEAARHLGVTNITGFAFWALETPAGLVPLAQLVSEGRVQVGSPTGSI